MKLMPYIMVDIVRGSPITLVQMFFYNDMYFLDVGNPELLKWTQVKYDPNSIVPPARSYECAVYSAQLDAFFLYGGLTFLSNRTVVEVTGDSWVYHFSTNTWTLLDVVAPPGIRSGHSCVLDASGKNAILPTGLWDNITIDAFYRDTWSWNLATNTWTNLTTSEPPVGRWLYGWDRIPGTNNFVLVQGRRLRQVYMTDIWAFNADTNVWTQMAVSNVQNPPVEIFGWALLSSKRFFMSGGDVDGNLTLADSCKPPLICFNIAAPTDFNYFLNLDFKKNTADWDDEAGFDHTTIRLRHATIVKMEPYLYLYGGHDWDGTHGIGEIYNTLTWGINIPNKYWS